MQLPFPIADEPEPFAKEAGRKLFAGDTEFVKGVVAMSGLPEPDRKEVCFAGRVVYIGWAKAPIEFETKYFVLKELDIRGSRNALPEDFRDVITMLEAGTFPLDTVITKTVSLDDAPAAMDAWSDDPASITKIQINLDA